MSQGLFFQVNVGISFKFLFGFGCQVGMQFWQFGLWICVLNKINFGVLNDVIIVFICFDFDVFILGFSYDINIFLLKVVSNYNGSFELVLQYKICGFVCCGVYCLSF